MKIYAKTGNSEMASLIERGRVLKNDIRIETYGPLNELNSSIGLLYDLLTNSDYKPIIENIQIITNRFFIIWHPLEKLCTLDKTTAQACKLKLDDNLATISTPIPGSPQYIKANQYDYLDQSELSKYN